MNENKWEGKTKAVYFKQTQKLLSYNLPYVTQLKKKMLRLYVKTLFYNLN